MAKVFAEQAAEADQIALMEAQMKAASAKENAE